MGGQIKVSDSGETTLSHAKDPIVAHLLTIYIPARPTAAAAHDISIGPTKATYISECASLRGSCLATGWRRQYRELRSKRILFDADNG